MVNTYSAHIPVTAGDLTGLFQNGGNCGTATDNPMDTFVFASGDVAPATTAPFVADFGAKYPVSVKVAVCVVPKLKGKTLAAAKDALADANCALGKVTKKESSGKAGIVLTQKPKAGTEPPGGVVVVVSTA
jgi:hypothetical protein